MHRSTLLIAFGALIIAPAASAQDVQRMAQPSTRASATVSLTPARGVEGVEPATIHIDYGQPHLRGRRLHTPDLVPFDSVWRFGANESTSIETGVDLELGGKRIAKGKYSLYALPTAAGWTLIVNSNTGQWGTEYAPQYDVARIALQKQTLATPVESFRVNLVPSREPGAPAGKLIAAWGDVELAADWRVP
ncbi:MAG: DUF2911 domain-containing protein [Gemmatimonadetes bacterium]|nr:DUF2911 domain-containing protein [Gemmatimonadota bacterium]